MWILFWKKYQFSKFATFVSIVGALVRYAGVMCLFSALIVPAIICIGIGVGIHFCAEAIAKGKQKKVLAKQQTAASVNETPKVEVQTDAQPTPAPVVQPEAPAAPINNTQSDDTMVKCSQCGALVSKDNKFCTDCGNSIVAAQQPKEKKCLRCGEKVEADNKFCPNCGYEIK